MSENESLKAILDQLKSFENRFDSIDQRFNSLEENLEERISDFRDSIESKVSGNHSLIEIMSKNLNESIGKQELRIKNLENILSS